MTLQEFTEYLLSSSRSDETLATLEKLGFSPEFVAKNVLSGNTAITVSHVAMLWMGMPNKHDRKRTRQLFDVLSEIGLLKPEGDEETWQLVSP